eukprot:Gb_30603 [translate_table: standard]
MSMPLQQQPIVVYPQAVSSNGGSHSNGSVGPVLAVLSVITILGVLACVMGRVCAGRLVSANSKYDCVGWMERRCASCIDGDVEVGGGGGHIPVAKPTENGEAKPTEGEAAG